MPYNLRDNRRQTKPFESIDSQYKPYMDLKQFVAKVVDKSVYYLCRFGGKTDCPFKSKANSVISIKSHICAHYMKDKTNRQSIGGQRVQTEDQRNRQSIGGKSVQTRDKSQDMRQKPFKCDEIDCQKRFKLKKSLKEHKKYHLCGFTVRPLEDYEICSDFNINKYFNRYKCFDSRHKNYGQTVYQCLIRGCEYECTALNTMRIHVHNSHVCPERGHRMMSIVKQFKSIESKSMFNRFECELKSINDLKISSDYLKRKRIENYETSSDEEMPSDQSLSDPQTDSYCMNSIVNIGNNNKRKVLPKIVNKINSKKTINELKINLNFETSSEQELPSDQALSGTQTDSNRVNSIVNIGNNNKRKIANKIKSKKTIAKTFKCSEKYCNQRFKHKILFIKHKNSHKNNANKNSLTKVSPNIKLYLKELSRRYGIKIKECLSQQKSRPKGETNDVNENNCMNETNEESIELIDLTVDESEDEDIKPKDMSEENRNHINTTLIKAEPMDDISNDSNERHINPSTGTQDWRAQIPRIEPFKRFVFIEMTQFIDSVVKECGNVSQNPFMWSLVSRRMEDKGFGGLDAIACYDMFNQYVANYYALALAYSPDERTANEVYPLFAFIHSLDLSQSLSQFSFDIISDLRQMFAQKSTNVQNI